MEDRNRALLWAIWDACMPILACLGFWLVSVAAYKSTIDPYKRGFIPVTNEDWFWVIFWLLIFGLIVILSISRAIKNYYLRTANYLRRGNKKEMKRQ